MSIDPGLLSILSVEARVMLLLAGGVQNDALVRELLEGPLDWQRLAALAAQEHSSGVTWRRIKPLAGGRIPADVAKAWERMGLVADFHTAFMRDRCLETIECLSNTGIDVILLKGAAHAHGVYANYLDRPMGDLDLLVPASRATDAWNAMRPIGWEWKRELYPAERYVAHHHLPPLLDAKGGFAKLELHSALTATGHPLSLDFEELRDVTRPVNVLGFPSRALNWNIQVVYLSVHFAWSHMLSFGGTRAFSDLSALIGTGRIDWDDVLRFARAHGVVSCCYWTFLLASKTAGIPVPESVIEKFRLSGSSISDGVVERHQVTQLISAEHACPSQALRRAMWGAAIRPKDSGFLDRRPWDADADFAAIRGVPESVQQKMSRHLEGFMRWASYLRLVGVPR